MTLTTGHTQYAVYALIDPRDHRIRYIGIAVDVQKRYYQHLHGFCNKYVRQWIKELQGVGLCPALQILEIVNRQAGTSFDEFMRIVCDREAHWIEVYARLGAPLLNRDGITKKYWKAFGKQRRLTSLIHYTACLLTTQIPITEKPQRWDHAITTTLYFTKNHLASLLSLILGITTTALLRKRASIPTASPKNGSAPER
jgi:hypothetical protein